MEANIAKYLFNNPKRADEKIAELIKGLDKDSVETVYRIVSRLQKSLLNNNKPVSQIKAEKTEAEKIESEFEPNVHMITPEKFYYNGYFLPILHFEVSVF